MSRIVFAFALCVSLAAPALAQSKLSITEKIEWTWTDRPDTPVPNLPNVLLVGDSITRGYYPATAKELAGAANVYLFATSCSSGDPRLPGQLHDYFAMIGVNFTVVHFNNGMHGWGYSETDYAAGLRDMVQALSEGAPRAELVWATTTPVLHDSANGQSSNARIDDRNSRAATLMKLYQIPTDDQHALMLQHQDLHNGDVHFTDAGSALQATQVAATIRTALSKQKPKQPTQ